MKKIKKSWKDLVRRTWYLPAYLLYRAALFYLAPLFGQVLIALAGRAEIDRLAASGLRLYIPLRELVFGVLPALLVAGALALTLYRLLRHKRFAATGGFPSEDFQKSMQKILDDFDYVESIQIYQYKKKQEDDFSVKINFLYGMADEEVEISSVMQAYYRIPTEIYGRMEKFSGLCDDYRRVTSDSSRLAVKAEIKQAGLELTELLLARLNAIKGVSAITEADFACYRLLRIVFPIISGNDAERYLAGGGVEDRLASAKPTALLGPAILNSPQIFRDGAGGGLAGGGKNRIYFSCKAESCGPVKRLIVLISMREELLGKYSAIDKYGEEIFDRLNKDICSARAGA